jgi:ribosomal-protein-alanine N-acetyltransferase
MNIIPTDRIDLIPATPEFVESLIAHEYARAGNLLNAVVPAGWPHDEAARIGFPIHLQAMREDAREQLWRIRLIVLRESRVVIGAVNLKGPPRENGDVEIGWGVSPEYQKRGFAIEAARTVIEWAFTQEGVKRVIATIPEDNVASIRVAERLGMHPTEEKRRGLPVWALDQGGAKR